jgi:hypothetical protein
VCQRVVDAAIIDPSIIGGTMMQLRRWTAILHDQDARERRMWPCKSTTRVARLSFGFGLVVDSPGIHGLQVLSNYGGFPQDGSMST